MSFAQPNWLWGLCGPAAIALVLVVMIFVRRRARAVRWPGIQRVVAAGNGLRAISPRGGVRRPWLLLLAASCLLVALARPRWGEVEEPVFQRAREVMIALDLSRSMLSQDVPPSRLERARLLMRSLLDGLRGERVGLVVFAGTSFVQVPLSADYQILTEFLPELKPDYMPQGGTDYSGMLRAAAGAFSETSNTDRYLLILSDGESTTSDWHGQLDTLRQHGVRVIALGVGTPAGSFIPDGKGGFVKDERGAVVLSKLEPATLQELATATDGVYRDASAWIDLPGLLADTVERGRAGAFTEQRNVKHIERFQWFLVPAFVFALLGLWREVAVRPRLRAVRRRAAPNAEESVVASAMIILLAALSLVVAPAAKAGVVRTAPPPAAPADAISTVRKTVARVAGLSKPHASDWRALAEQTLAYGNEARAAKKPIERGAVLDALDAVDLGEKADPAEADWPKLREGLKALLEKPPEQQQQQQQQKKDQQQQKQDQQQSGGSDQQQQQKQDQQQQQKNQSAGDQQKKDDSSNQPQSEQSKGDQKKDESSGQQQQQQPPPATSGGEMGELKNEPKDAQPKAAPQQPQSSEQKKTQKFGGQPVDNSAQMPTNPDEAAALQRLRQVGDQDSPARLYELIEGENKQSAQSGRDW